MGRWSRARSRARSTHLVAMGKGGSVRSYLPVLADLEDVSCACCGSREAERMLEHDSFGFPVGLAICVRCGLAYSTPRPTEPYMERFYRRHYLAFYEGCRELTEEYVRQHALREAARERVARYAPLLPTGGRVLDVGCGAGFFLSELKRVRPDVEILGIEPGDMQARYAFEQLGVPVVTLPYQRFSSVGPFDLVTAFHVTEHVHDLGGFLDWVRGELGPQGHAVIESPNLDGSWTDFGMFHLAHLYAFTPASLGTAAALHGLAVERVTLGETGWDWPNLHVTLTPASGPLPATRPHQQDVMALRARMNAVAVPRWVCVLKSWVKLAVHTVGLRPYVDRLRRGKLPAGRTAHGLISGQL